MNTKALDAVSQISNEAWEDIALELARYTLSVSRRLRWRTQNPVELPGGETVDSIVSKSFEKLFSGDRDWDPDKEPDVKQYLMSVIDSLLNHLAESNENTLITVVPEPGSTDAAAWERGSLNRDPSTDWLVPARPTPEAVVLKHERLHLEDQALDLLIDECSDDEVLIKVLEARIDGYETPAKIAKEKVISIQEVYNAAKRLDRKLEKIRGRIASE